MSESLQDHPELSDLEIHRIALTAIETIRRTGLTDGIDYSELLAILELSADSIYGLSAPNGTEFNVVKVDPKYPAGFLTRISDSYGKKATTYARASGTFSFERFTDRDLFGRPVFRGKLYSFLSEGKDFRIHNLDSGVELLLSPDFKVELNEIGPVSS